MSAWRRVGGDAFFSRLMAANAAYDAMARYTTKAMGSFGRVIATRTTANGGIR